MEVVDETNEVSSKHVEVVDGTDVVSILHIRQGDIDVV
ncbi:chlorohydrolase [Streptococcus pneumoniae]|nr:chlorohydrolase [Streptococcus pneumoniae]